MSSRRARSPTRCLRVRSRTGTRLIWEYQFRFGGGRPPWASGMAQAVAAQALARSSALLADPNLGAAAVRAFASVPPFLLSLPSGPWIRLYGFNGAGRPQRAAAGDRLAARVRADHEQRGGDRTRAAAEHDGAGALPALRHRRLVALRARRRLCPARLPEVRHRPAREARAADAGSVLDRDVAALPRVLLRPAAGDAAAAGDVADDLAAAARRLSRRRDDPDHALDARVRVDLDRRQGDDVSPERGHAHAHVEAARRPRAGHVSGAGSRR